MEKTKEINYEKIEKLNALKIKQEKLAKEIATEQESTKNDAKKADGIINANNRLDKLSLEATEKYDAQLIQLKELKKVLKKKEGYIVFEIKTDQVHVTPFAYIINEQLESERWEGERVSADHYTLIMKYKGIPIGSEYKVNRPATRKWTFTLPYEVTDGSLKTYTRAKTIIEKIDNYLAQLKLKKLEANQHKQAIDKAEEFLKTIVPDANISAERTGKYAHPGRHINFIEFTKLIVTMSNGNSAEYRVRYNSESIYTLSLLTFSDKRTKSIKSNPVEMLNFLK